MVGGLGTGWEDCLDWQKCFGSPFHLSLTYQFGVCTIAIFSLRYDIE